MKPIQFIGTIVDVRIEIWESNLFLFNISLIFNRLDLALYDINKAIEFDRENTIFYDNRAYLYLFYEIDRYVWRKLEKYNKALEDYNIIIGFNPENVKVLINRAFCYAKMEIYDEAVNDYSRVLDIEPANTHALYNRAISYDKISKLNEAIVDFSKIIEIEPMNANAYLNRGCCYEKLQKVELAYKDYEASLLIDKILENMEQQKGNEK